MTTSKSSTRPKAQSDTVELVHQRCPSFRHTVADGALLRRTRQRQIDLIFYVEDYEVTESYSAPETAGDMIVYEKQDIKEGPFRRDVAAVRLDVESASTLVLSLIEQFQKHWPDLGFNIKAREGKPEMQDGKNDD